MNLILIDHIGQTGVTQNYLNIYHYQRLPIVALTITNTENMPHEHGHLTFEKVTKSLAKL